MTWFRTSGTLLITSTSNLLIMIWTIGDVKDADTTLIIGYDNIMKASGDITREDLSVSRHALVPKFLLNPLGAVFESLAKFLVMPSAESIDLVRSKTSKSRSGSPKKTGSPRKKARLTKVDDTDEITLENLPSILDPPIIIDSSTTPSTPPANKRDFSGESFGRSSTETTPTKINRPEPFTQDLQNCLSRELIRHLWIGGPRISWAENRTMYLDYLPYYHVCDSLTVGQ